MPFKRRTFLRGGALVTAGAGLSLSSLFSRSANADIYGPLRPDPDGVLDLPAGFTYEIIERHFDRMDDGYRVPGRPDGMACMVADDGNWVLMRNHEISIGDFANGPLDLGTSPPPESYHRAAPGGVTRLVVDPRTGSRISSNLVLIGTARNCGGGPSPWGWLSCEENTASTHGYVFLCDVNAASVQDPVRIPTYGRCYREGAAIDPRDNAAYLTEDRSDGSLYRFLPTAPDRPFEGQLQALAIVGQPRRNLASALTVGDTLSIEWVNLDVAVDPEPSDNLRDVAQDAGAAILRRGEGIWYHEGTIYVCSTTGGPASSGQIFRLDPVSSELELIGQSLNDENLDMPDNITLAWNGDVYMAEDGGGENFLRVLRPDGTVCDFARNAVSDSEFAGVCFSPDGHFLFVNIQVEGLTLAITGPFSLPMMPVGDGGLPDSSLADASLADASLADGGGSPDAIAPMPDAGSMPPVNDDGCGCSIPGAGSTDLSKLAGAVAVGAAVYSLRSEPGDDES